MLQWLGLATSVTAAFLAITQPHSLTIPLITGGLIFSCLMWVFGILKRRRVYCPLCRGTPLIDSQARVHSKAKRIRPLNHGITAIVSILATHRFRCMYCGSDYDLFKESPRRRHAKKLRNQVSEKI